MSDLAHAVAAEEAAALAWLRVEQERAEIAARARVRAFRCWRVRHGLTLEQDRQVGELIAAGVSTQAAIDTVKGLS